LNDGFPFPSTAFPRASPQWSSILLPPKSVFGGKSVSYPASLNKVPRLSRLLSNVSKLLATYRSIALVGHVFFLTDRCSYLLLLDIRLYGPFFFPFFQSVPPPPPPTAPPAVISLPRVLSNFTSFRSSRIYDYAGRLDSFPSSGVRTFFFTSPRLEMFVGPSSMPLGCYWVWRARDVFLVELIGPTVSSRARRLTSALARISPVTPPPLLTAKAGAPRYPRDAFHSSCSALLSSGTHLNRGSFFFSGLRPTSVVGEVAFFLLPRDPFR